MNDTLRKWLDDYLMNQHKKETALFKQILEANYADYINRADDVPERKRQLLERLKDDTSKCGSPPVETAHSNQNEFDELRKWIAKFEEALISEIGRLKDDIEEIKKTSESVPNQKITVVSLLSFIKIENTISNNTKKKLISEKKLLGKMKSDIAKIKANINTERPNKNFINSILRDISVGIVSNAFFQGLLKTIPYI